MVVLLATIGSPDGSQSEPTKFLLLDCTRLRQTIAKSINQTSHLSLRDAHSFHAHVPCVPTSGIRNWRVCAYGLGRAICWQVRPRSAGVKSRIDCHLSLPKQPRKRRHKRTGPYFEVFTPRSVSIADSFGMLLPTEWMVGAFVCVAKTQVA